MPVLDLSATIPRVVCHESLHTLPEDFIDDGFVLAFVNLGFVTNAAYIQWIREQLPKAGSGNLGAALDDSLAGGDHLVQPPTLVQLFDNGQQ